MKGSYGTFEEMIALLRATIDDAGDRKVYHLRCEECGKAMASPMPHRKYCDGCNLERKRSSSLRTIKKRKEVTQ